MSAEIGMKIREARTAAGMSQAKLADAVDGVTASGISKAERGIKELTPEQLQAIAEATGVAPETLMTAETVEAVPEKTDAPSEPEKETAEEITVEVTEEEKELIDSFKAADAETQNAVTSVLKDESPQSPLAGIVTTVAGMMGASEEKGEQITGVVNGLTGLIGSSGEKGGQMVDTVNGVAGMVGALAASENPIASVVDGLTGVVSSSVKNGDKIVGIANGIAGVLGGNGENGENPLVGVVSGLVGKMVSAAGKAASAPAETGSVPAETTADDTAENEDQKSE